MRWVEVDDKYTLSSRKFTRNPGEDGSGEHTRVSVPARCTPASAPTLRSGRDVCALFSRDATLFLSEAPVQPEGGISSANSGSYQEDSLHGAEVAEGASQAALCCNSE